MTREPVDVFLRRTDSTNANERDFGDFTATTLQWRGGATSLALIDGGTGKHANAYFNHVEKIEVQQVEEAVVLVISGENVPPTRVHFFGLTVLDLARAANVELARVADEALDEALERMGGAE